MRRLGLYGIALIGLLTSLQACKGNDTQSEPLPQPADLLTVSVSEIDILSAKVKVTATDSDVVYFVNAWPQESLDMYLITHTEQDFNNYIVSQLIQDTVTPEMFANEYCKKGNWKGSLSGMEPKTLYYAFAFTYDWKTKKVGERCYRQSFRTRSQGDVQLSFDITVNNITSSGADVTVIPSDSMVYYYYLLVDSSFVKAYSMDRTALNTAKYIMTNYYRATINEYNSDFGTEYTFYDFPSASYRAYKGKDMASYTDLSSGKDYLLIAFKTSPYCDVIEPISVYTFQTKKK